MTNNEKALKLVKECLDDWPYAATRVVDIMMRLEQVKALLKEQEWKLITEDSDGILHGLPGDDGTYLMTDGKDIWIDEYVDGVADGIFLDSGRDIRDIKAWMYMPELPEQKGGEIG